MTGTYYVIWKSLALREWLTEGPFTTIERARDFIHDSYTVAGECIIIQRHLDNTISVVLEEDED